jgi:transcription termination factor NusB
VTARGAAHEVVRRVFEDDAYADRVLRTAAAGLDTRDRALAQRLAFGTVQRVRTLDHAIGTLGKRPVRKLDPPVLAALRLGAYQLGFTDVPSHAAVNETVELVRAARLERAVAFTNAVMRRLDAGLEGLLAALPEGTATDAALKHSYPDWVAELWWDELGERDALALMRAQNEPPERVVRRNRRKAGDVAGQPDPDLPDACTSIASTRTRSRQDSSGLRAGAPSLRGSSSIRGRASASSTSARRPAVRRRSSRETSSRSSSIPGVRASWRRTAVCSAPTTWRSSTPTRRSCPRS